eukprot:CAMPEP_0171647940 /NCGR_PEP_ID=MMETSP0990-20121206/35800_1 /TAXON_ID=483369 /ORGANISM="non described non described, Strain CCMP2098" /LENGTH=93 /DNA_ID=CAMNT_0012225349 /DNA_START=408 /DNA_END=689 /DNA_ORIENTATION=+
MASLAKARPTVSAGGSAKASGDDGGRRVSTRASIRLKVERFCKGCVPALTISESSLALALKIGSAGSKDPRSTAPEDACAGNASSRKSMIAKL